MAHFWRWLAAVRPRFLTLSALAVLLAFHHGSQSTVLDPFRALLTLALALIIHALANVLNDYWDQDTDGVNQAFLFPFTGGSRLIQQGVLSPEQFKHLAGMLTLALVAGASFLLTQLAALASPVAWALAGLGAFGLMLAYGYSARPIRLSARALGEVCVASGWLGLYLGAYLVAAAPRITSWSHLGQELGSASLRALPWALLVALLLFINQIPDIEADRRCGKITLVQHLSATQLPAAYLLLWSLSLALHLWAAFKGLFHTVALGALLGYLPGVAAIAYLWRWSRQPSAAMLRRAIVMTLAAAHLYPLTMIAWGLFA